MCPATVWIIFTRVLNTILAVEYNCLVQLFNSLVQIFHTFSLNLLSCLYFIRLGGNNNVSKMKRGRWNKKVLETLG